MVAPYPWQGLKGKQLQVPFVEHVVDGKGEDMAAVQSPAVEQALSLSAMLQPGIGTKLTKWSGPGGGIEIAEK